MFTISSMMYFAQTQFGNLVLFINCYYFKDTYFIFLFHYKDMSPDGSGSSCGGTEQDYSGQQELHLLKKKDNSLQIKFLKSTLSRIVTF